MRGLLVFTISILISLALNGSSLRETAFSRGLYPVPADLDSLIALYKGDFDIEKARLGKELFFDPILSKDGSVSCASCHDFAKGGADAKAAAVGIGGAENPFHLNSPTVFNAALAKMLFWDGRAKSLAEQAAGPITAPFEMGLTPKEAVEKVSGSSYYAQRFEKLYNKAEIEFEDILDAIAMYEKTLLTRGDFDRFLEGDETALNERAKRGLKLFMSIGCKGCHTGMSVGGQSIQKFPLRKYNWFNLKYEEKRGLYIDDSPYPFENLGGFWGKDGALRFRVPILRNVTKTAPYFHNGSVKELKKAVEIMARHQLGKELTKKEIEDIVEFLKSLEGSLVDYGI